MSNEVNHRMDKYSTSRNKKHIARYLLLFVLFILIVSAILGAVYLHTVQKSVNRS